MNLVRSKTTSRMTLRTIMAVAAAVLLLGPTTGLASEGSGGPSLFTGDLGNIIWTLLTFFIVLGVLGKFAWGPILGALKNREDFIRDSLEKAKAERTEAEAMLAEYKEQVATAKAEASAIVEEGRRDAEVVKRSIEEKARQTADELVDRAKREISLATNTAVKELYSLSVNLSTEMASRIIGKELSPADHERLIEESLAELSRTGKGQGTA